METFNLACVKYFQAYRVRDTTNSHQWASVFFAPYNGCSLSEWSFSISGITWYSSSKFWDPL